MKKEYIILTVVMAALVLYLAVHKSNRTHYKLPMVSEPVITKNPPYPKTTIVLITV